MMQEDDGLEEKEQQVITQNNTKVEYSNDFTVTSEQMEERYPSLFPKKEYSPVQRRKFSAVLPKDKKKRDKILKEKIDGYIDAFTVHGLTRVFKAPKREAILWMVVLCLGIFLTTIVLYKLLAKYFKYETYTEIKSVVTDKNYFPSLSICELKMLQRNYFSYCGQSMSPLRDGKSSKQPCDHAKIPTSAHNASMIGNQTKSWSNGLFDVLYCYTWDSKDCNSLYHFRSNRNLNHSCITWNYQGDMTDLYGHVEIGIKFHAWDDREPKIFASPHDPNLIEIDLTKKVNLDAHKLYEIKLVKTEVKRLPNPYPSNCSSQRVMDILPGDYSRRTCIESYKMLNAYKECGDTFDYVRPHIPEKIKTQYSKNSSVKETRACIRRAVQKEPEKGRCPFPCRELDLGISSSYNERHGLASQSGHNGPHEWTYNVALQFQHVDYYKIMEEKALYSGNQLTCEVGGFLGLVMGASMLSFVEILVCGALYMMRKMYNNEQEDVQ
ncbi:acid-sensing ion channel 5-like [Clytia hemisphaerica]